MTKAYDRIKQGLEDARDGKFITHQPCDYSCDMTHDDVVGPLYYFRPLYRSPGPYKTQVIRRAIIDIAADGTLAGVELIDDMPPPPGFAKEDTK